MRRIIMFELCNCFSKNGDECLRRDGKIFVCEIKLGDGWGGGGELFRE